MKESKSFSLKGTQKSSNFLDGYLSDETKKDSQIVSKPSESYTRQTFMIKESTLNKLKDFVHTKRKNEDYNYSQKQALEEALNLLFDTIDVIEKRITNS